uniref:Proline-rich protein 36-like n=1 Tax=Callorhinus ursinus TaxID=34884 RepID=A0A3Q7QA68_CALUR|nr:proline-rich protein 36-like [Callorhinus ursinus]
MGSQNPSTHVLPSPICIPAEDPSHPCCPPNRSPATILHHLQDPPLSYLFCPVYCPLLPFPPHPAAIPCSSTPVLVLPLPSTSLLLGPCRTRLTDSEPRCTPPAFSAAAPAGGATQPAAALVAQAALGPAWLSSIPCEDTAKPSPLSSACLQPFPDTYLASAYGEK